MITKTEIIEKEIIGGIVRGTFKTGSKIPSRQQLMKRFACSRVTVERAVANLTRAGYLTGHQGSGTIVLTKQPENRIRELRIVTAVSLLIPDQPENYTFRLFKPDEVFARMDLLTAPGGAVLWIMPGEEHIFLMDILAERKVPQLLVNRSYRNYDCILTDPFSSLQEGLAWLMIESGREIAFLSRNLSTEFPYLAERIIAFFTVCTSLGARLNPDYTILRDFPDIPGGISEVAASLFSRKNIPKGIFILNQDLTMPFVTCAKHYNLTAGRDFRLLVFDDIPELENMPGIAMMEQPYRKFREEITNWLLNIAGTDHGRFCRKLKTEFRVGAEVFTQGNS